jgi:hypothetical protein
MHFKEIRPMHTVSMKRVGRLLAAAALLAALGSAGARADIASYYILADGLPVFTSGVYNGYANPNFNRLTFAYAHTYATNPANNHYHTKGRYQLSNSPPNVVTNINANNYLPEGAIPPLVLRRGTGIYFDKLASLPYTDTADPGYPFSKLEIRSVLDLVGFTNGSPEDILYKSSNRRWTNLLTGADIHLELVHLSPGLNVGTTNALSVGLSMPGDELHLGDGAQPISFTPVFWTDLTAPPGVYIARFKLTDENGVFGESGPFEFRVEVKPRALASYYILVDGLPVFTSGVYNGYANPNFNRLTFAYAHTYATNPTNNHYHTKGRYQLSNSPPNIVTNINQNNYLPEGALPPLPFAEGVGLYAGKRVIAPLANTNDPSYEFSLLEMRNVQDLTGYPTNSPEHFLYRSSNRRWTNLLHGAHVRLELVNKSDGLNIGTAQALSIGLENPGDQISLGLGHEFFAFTPVFWIAQNAPPGPYVARFKLVDMNGTFAESGPFEFRLYADPPPAELALDQDAPIVALQHTATSRVYRIWTSTNLLDGSSWTLHAGPLPGTGSNLWAALPTNEPALFIRYDAQPTSP